MAKVIEDIDDPVEDLDEEEEGLPPSDKDDEGDEDEKPEPKGKGEKAGKAKPDELAAIRAELESLKRTNQELQIEARTWANMAKGRPEPKQEKAAEADDIIAELLGSAEVEDANKVAEDFALNGLKALKESGLVSKRQLGGILKKYSDQLSKRMLEQMEAVAEGKARSIAKDSEVFTTYPDLKNDQSELYKLTAQILMEMEQDEPGSAKRPASLKAAARAAAAELKAKGAGERKKEPDDYERYEDDRDARVRAQNGERGRGRHEGGGEMTQQQRIVAKMMGVPEKDYAAAKLRVGGRR